MLLGAIAQATERIVIGAMVTPVARRRPWKLAREVATLDALAGGRVAFAVRLGAPERAEFGVFGEETDARIRAARLDEGTAIVDGLLGGRPFAHAGEHFHLDEVTFLPAPARRIPIWVAGNWPNPRPFRRAARWDGVVPEKVGGGLLSPGDVREAVAFVDRHRPDERRGAPFDVVVGAFTPADDPAAAAALAASYAEAGVTWRMERLHVDRGSLDENRRRVLAGPPAPRA